jgi:hypothetical protein
MTDVASSTGYFAKAMDAANDPIRNQAQYHKELMQVLESSPKKWDIMTNSMKNSLAKAFIPLIPVIFSLMNLLRQAAEGFAKLNPKTRTIILFGLALVAIVGPILIIIGSLMNLIGTYQVFVKMFWDRTKLLLGAFKAIGIGFLKYVVQPILIMLETLVGAIAGTLGIPVWAVLAIIVAIAATIALVLKTDIEDPFIRVFQSIVHQLAQLPRVVADIFIGVIQVLGRAMQVVVDLLSYLNPFARHSPSLVDNVTAGVSTILDQYDRLKSIPATVARAMASLGAFRAVASNDITGFRRTKTDADVAKITAINPAAGAAAGVMADSIDELYAALEPLTIEIDIQSRVVDDLSRAYDAATKKMDAANDVVDAITEELNGVGDKLDAAKNKLNDFANAPITGMREMEDQIFANSQAQNVLNLRLLEFEKAGMSIDKIQDKWAALNGDIEMLRGKKEDLRLAGAGSDVLGAYDEQIQALEDQKGGLQDSQREIEGIQKQLDDLDLEGRFLDLTKSITFDPLVRQIDQMVNGVAEMDFDDIVAGIKEQQKVVGELQPQYDSILQRQKDAQAVAKEAAQAQKLVGDQLDVEQDKLNQLEDAYSDIKDLIQEMESEMANYLSLAETAANIEKTKKGDEESLFSAAEGVNFDIAGGDSTLGREGGLQDIEDFNKDLEAEIEKAMGDMGDMDIFGFFQDAIDKLMGYKDKAVEFFKKIPGWAGEALQTGLAFLSGPVWQWTQKYIIDPITGAFDTIGDWLMSHIVTPIWDFFTSIASAVVTFFQDLGGGIGDIWNTYIYPVFDALMTVLGVLKDIFVTVWDAIWGAVQKAWEIISPIFKAIWDFIDGYIMPIFELLFVTAEIVFVGIWKIIQVMWDIVLDIFRLFWDWTRILIDAYGWMLTHIDTIFSAIWKVIQIAWGVIKVIFDAIVWFINNVLVVAFNWFGDRVKWVVDNIITPAMNWLRDNVFTPVMNAIESVVRTSWGAIETIFGGMMTILAPVQTALKWLYNSVIKPIMNAIGTIFAAVWTGIATVIGVGINAFITGFNLLAGAINAVASLLGIGSKVSTMDPVSLGLIQFHADTSVADAAVNGSRNPNLFAAGGIMGRDVIDRMGGSVKGAHTLVGEGSNIHPEYIIPTDPRYRQRARGLYRELGHTFGEDAQGYSNMDLFGIGGAVKNGFNAAKGALGSVGGFLKDKAVEAIWSPAHWAAQQAINLIPVDFFKNIGQGVLNGVDGWITGADQAWNEESTRRKPVLTGPGGSGSWKVIPPFLDQMGVPYKILSTNRPGSITRTTGKLSYHALDRAIDLAGPSGMVNYSPHDLLAINKAIYTGFKPYLKELIYGGPGAQTVNNGSDHVFSSALQNEHINHVHAALARGGFIVPRRPNGSLLRVGEGLHDEAVQVTPLHGNNANAGGETTINFYGDLSFPNITDPNQAEQLITNLKSLAGVN